MQIRMIRNSVFPGLCRGRLNCSPDCSTIGAMRSAVLLLFALCLLGAGFEGALDAADPFHGDDASFLHDEHHPHAADPGEPGESDPDSHAHACHCGLHVPPLVIAMTPALIASLQHVSPVTEPALHALALGPPPLPPPIA